MKVPSQPLSNEYTITIEGDYCPLPPANRTTVLPDFVSQLNLNVGAVYGEDDRKKIIPATHSAARSYFMGVAVKISKNSLTDNGDGTSTIQGAPLGDLLKIRFGASAAGDVLFRSQATTLGLGTGFLVADNLILTAKHCVFNMDNDEEADIEEYNNYYWIFGLYVEGGTSNSNFVVKNTQIFATEQVLQYSQTDPGDWALVLVGGPGNNNTLGFPKLPLYKGVPKEGDQLWMLGYPDGLPLKYTDNGRIIKVDNCNFYHNLDSFHGNSGSPIIRIIDDTVCGILISGCDDYYIDESDNKLKRKIYPEHPTTSTGSDIETAQHLLPAIHLLLTTCNTITVEFILSEDEECTIIISISEKPLSDRGRPAQIHPNFISTTTKEAIFKKDTLYTVSIEWNRLATYAKYVEFKKEESTEQAGTPMGSSTRFTRVNAVANGVRLLNWFERKRPHLLCKIPVTFSMGEISL